MNPQKILSALAVGALTLGASWMGGAARASSHSDAPLIMLDPQANLTDVYAFVRNNSAGVKSLVVEVSVRPFSEPGDGVMYDSFSDDARYSISIANPNTGAELQRYDFQFSRVDVGGGGYKNLNTILRYGRGADIAGSPDVGAIMNVGDAHQNFTQTYTVTRFVDATGASTTLSQDSTGHSLMVPPYNTGPRATPLYNDMRSMISDGMGGMKANPNFGRAVSGASTRAGLDTYTRQTVYDLPTFSGDPAGVTTFAGVREDGFYADTAGIFDLLDPRILIPTGSTANNIFGQAGGGVDGFKGFNVFHYAITIPLTDLPAPIAYQAPFTNGITPNGAVGARLGLGVYASVSRPRITLRSTSGINANSGPFIQVNRLANPLFNEVLVGLQDKDNYNRDSPTNDVAKYQKYALNPEVGVLINAVYGAALPAPIVVTGRTDLAAVYTPDVIRVDTTTGPARAAGEANFSRLSVLGGDTLTTASGAAIPGGWPNGRRLGDDVIDIALTAVASGPSYSSPIIIGDNVAANDQVYNTTFPYAATPWGGTHNSKDSSINVGF